MSQTPFDPEMNGGRQLDLFAEEPPASTELLPEQIQKWAAARGLTHQQHAAGTAVFGADLVHRYALTRTWAPGGTHRAYV
ncbi:hypothetical protein ACFQ7A_04990, partial [Streptomyces sp. NPDC056528]